MTEQTSIDSVTDQVDNQVLGAWALSTLWMVGTYWLYFLIISAGVGVFTGIAIIVHAVVTLILGALAMAAMIVATNGGE